MPRLEMAQKTFRLPYFTIAPMRTARFGGDSANVTIFGVSFGGNHGLPPDVVAAGTRLVSTRHSEKAWGAVRPASFRPIQSRRAPSKRRQHRLLRKRRFKRTSPCHPGLRKPSAFGRVPATTVSDPLQRPMRHESRRFRFRNIDDPTEPCTSRGLARLRRIVRNRGRARGQSASSPFRSDGRGFPG